MSNIQLANNLRFLRTKHKLTQDDLSSLLLIQIMKRANEPRIWIRCYIYPDFIGFLSMNWSLIIFRVLITQAL